jgi:hypothetical protein
MSLVTNHSDCKSDSDPGRELLTLEELEQLLADSALAPGTARCKDCDAMTCGIGPCAGHRAQDAWDRWVAEEPRREAEAAEQRERRQRHDTRWRERRGEVVTEVVRDLLVKELPAALRYLREREARRE